eukprot:TRINITY_DN1958_c0_g1_i1.p1 TRINITY_DN1958_c0_g1~~TRINITY_DN1958_c0_g1_i1.p1  ORF type:complete len:1280 (+),score=267.84 TRINITY_DN1958_c0_g1_i1:76-3915(+)
MNNCQIMADSLFSRTVHTDDRKKNKTEKQRKSHKGDIDKDKYKLQTYSEAERLAWLAEIQRKLKNLHQEEINARILETNYEQATFRWMKSYNRQRTAFFHKQIAARVGRGIVSHSAARRLVREIAKIERDPSWGVAAKPLDDSLLLWHCNLAAPGGVTGKGVLHVELAFPVTYPACPPKVKILGANVDHPNIFGNYICMDLLNQGEFSVAEHVLKPFTGWSAAYGVQTLLIQLQSFFFSGVDSGYGKGEYIRIRPHSGEAVWEYQLTYDECHHWSDFKYDEFAFCGHYGSVPGKCRYNWCDGKGRWGPKWVSMHQQDMQTLDTRLNLFEDALKRDEADEGRTEFEAPLYRTFTSTDMVFARRLPRPRDISIIGVVKFATDLNIDMSAYHKSMQFNASPYLKTQLKVEVTFGKKSRFETRNYCMPLSFNENSILPEAAGPQTPAWFQQFVFKRPASYCEHTDVHFTVVNVSPRSRDVIGVASVKVDTLTEKNTQFILKLSPPLTKGALKAASKSGGCGSIVIDARIVPPAPQRKFVFDFKSDRLDGTMSQYNQFNEERSIRRREGYRCEMCNHTPIECVPKLPSAVDCDDAPPFALAEFHAALTESVGDNNPEALAAINRCVDSLQEELDEKNGKKKKKKDNHHSNIFYIPNDAMMIVMEYLPRNRERRYLSQIFSPWTVLYEDARFWEAQHLKCFTTGATPSEDVLGVGVLSAEAMHGRPVFSCQFDPISKTAYDEGVRIGVWKEKFTHWVPLYINKNHADRSMKEFIPQLKKLSVGVRSANSAWTVAGADIDGKGKERLVRVPGKRHVFRSTGWSGIRGGNFAASGSHYFQVEIVKYSFIPNLRVAGKFAAHGVVKIGWITASGDVNIGTDDQGFCFSTQGMKVHCAEREEYGTKVVPGDVVGTLWDANSRKISFFLNGKPLGVAFNVPRKGYPGLIPAVALSHATIEVDIEGGYNPPCVVECETLGAHDRAASLNIGNCLAVLPQLMNHMVVEVMKGQLHASVKALNGYCALHRLFLYTADLWPELQETVEGNLRRFIEHPSERHKVITPDLGVILCMLTISKKYRWNDLKNSFLSELFTRHVRWSLKKSRRFAAGQLHPRMAKDHEMVSEAFFANETSCKLVMFQVFFANLVKPCEEYFALRDDPYLHTKELYDSRMGFPTADMVDSLVSEIASTNTRLAEGWNGFLQGCGAERRTNADIAKRIRDAVDRSNIAGYHADVELPDRGYASRILRMPPKPRPKPGEKLKPNPKRAPKREVFDEDKYFDEVDDVDERYG